MNVNIWNRQVASKKICLNLLSMHWKEIRYHFKYIEICIYYFKISIFKLSRNIITKNYKQTINAYQKIFKRFEFSWKSKYHT